MLAKLSMAAAVLIGLTACGGVMHASDIFIAQNASGANSGSSCADAHAYTFFNDSGNWGSGGGEIGPGTTVHLCGTFTGGAGSTMLTAQGSGASGSPVIVLFENGADLTSPDWSGSTGAINLNGQSWIIVDGGQTCGYVQQSDVPCNGTIENTANGTGLANATTSVGVYAAGTSNVTIRNLNIVNLYVHKSVNDQGVDQSNINAIKAYPPASNLTINNNFIHDCGWCLNGYGNNLVEHHNDIFNSDHPINAGVNSGSYSNITHHDNHIHDMANWDTNSNAYHHDGIYDWGETGGSISGIYIYNNRFDGDPGHNLTAWIFQDGQLNNVYDFNNVMKVPLGRIMNGGSIEVTGLGCSGCGNFYLLNNTVIDNNVSNGGACYSATNGYKNVNFENNISIGCQTDVYFTNVGLGTVDHNTYDNSSIITTNSFGWNGSNTSNLGTWQSECACDAHSKFASAAQIGLGSDGRPQVGSVALGEGSNLTGIGIAALDSDGTGSARPSAGAWSDGALAAITGGTGAGLTPPSGMVAVVH